MTRPPKKHKPIDMKFDKVLESLADSIYVDEKKIKKQLKVKNKK